MSLPNPVVVILSDESSLDTFRNSEASRASRAKFLTFYASQPIGSELDIPSSEFGRWLIFLPPSAKTGRPVAGGCPREPHRSLNLGDIDDGNNRFGLYQSTTRGSSNCSSSSPCFGKRRALPHPSSKTCLARRAIILPVGDAVPEGWKRSRRPASPALALAPPFCSAGQHCVAFSGRGCGGWNVSLPIRKKDCSILAVFEEAAWSGYDAMRRCLEMLRESMRKELSELY